MSRLWLPEKGKLSIPGAWLPRRFREEQERRPGRRPSRAQIRRFLHQSKTRKDGTRFTQSPLHLRKSRNRRRNRAARLARRTR